MPTIEALPPGPRRDLAEALHGLYRAAGKPSLRDISTSIAKRRDLPAAVSHDTASQMLRGQVIPGWIRMESLVRYLSDAAVSRTRPETANEVERFHRLWLAAEESPTIGPTEGFLVPTAIDQVMRELQSTSIERRLGALYGVERLAWRSDGSEEQDTAEHWQPVLANYIRLHAAKHKVASQREPGAIVPEDVQLAAIILGRLPGRRLGGKFDLSSCNLKGIRWNGAYLDDAVFDLADLSYASLQDAFLVKASFRGATLRGACLDLAELNLSDMTEAKLADASMNMTRLANARLVESELMAADLDSARADGVDLTGANADRAIFRTARLARAKFVEASLVESSFSNADLTEADFTGANLTNADFEGAGMAGAIFTSANVAQASLTRSQLDDIRISDGGSTESPAVDYSPPSWYVQGPDGDTAPAG